MLVRSRSQIGSQTSNNLFYSILNSLRNPTIKLPQTLAMVTRSTSKRPMCPSCSKPARLCLCTRIKTPILDNSVAVTILQHSLEKKHPLNSTRIATLGLKNLSVVWVSDVNFEAQFDIRLIETNCRVGSVNSEPSQRCFDPIGALPVGIDEPAITFTIRKRGFISSLIHRWMPLTEWHKPNFDELLASTVALDSLGKGFVVKKMLKKKQSNGSIEDEEFEIEVPPGSVLLFPSERSVGAEAIDFEVKNLIVLDGTWAKAKKMYSENPWLKFLPHLKLEVDKPSLFSEVRHQPRAGYLSSIESIVYALKALGESDEGLDGLLDVFESMVADQRQCKDERLSKAT